MPSRSSTPTGEPSSSSISVHNPAFEQEDDATTHLQRKDKTRANDNYGSISVPEDSTDQDNRHNLDGQENGDTLGPGGPWRLPLCVVFILVMVLSCVAVLILLIMTPDFAQRSFETGVIFDLKEASIVNATQQDNINVLAMHVAGSITLRDQAYTLATTAAWILGSIGIGHSALLVYHAPSSFIIGSQSADHAAMGTIHLPPLELSSDSRSTPFDFITRFVVDNDKELMLFAQDAVASKQVAWQLTGPVRLQLGWFSAKVDFDKQVSLEGMDGLKQASLQSVAFPGTHSRGGIALEGAVEIYNPSSTLSLRLGDVDFGIYLPNDHGNDKLIAVVRAEDASLLGQQNNVFEIHGRTIPMSNNDRQGKELMDKFLSSYLHGNTSIVHVRGSPFGPDDDPQESSSSTTPAWLRKALQSLTLEIPFPGTKHSDLIRSLELSNIKIDFSSSGRPVISADIAAMLQKPEEMQFSINVTEIHPRVFLYLNADSKEPFGQLLPEKPSPAHTIEDDDDLPPGMLKVTSRISRAPFTVMPGKDDEFQKFLGKIFNGKRGTVYIRGTADAMVDSAFGHLTIHDLEFKGQIDSQGMGGMKDPPPRVTSISLKHGATDALYIQSELEIMNPSDIQVNMGLVHFSLEFDGQIIGEIILQELKLDANTSNKMLTQGRLFADKPVPVVDYIGKYISAQRDTPLTISGRHPNATFCDLLLPLVRSMEFTVVPPLFDEPPLLAAMQLNVLSSTTVLWLRNPFSHIKLEMIQLNATAVYQTTEIGTAHANFHDAGEGWTEPVMLPPVLCSSSNTASADNCSAITVQTPKIPVITKKLGLDMIKKALGGEIELSIDSIVTIQIDDLVLYDLRYKRNNLTATVNKGF